MKWSENSNKRVLPENEAKQVFDLFDKIDTFVGEASGIFKKKADEKKSVDANAFRKEIREYWYENPQLVDQFIAQRGNDLTEEQKNILLSWKHAIHGQFICLKYYKNYAIFGSAKEDSTQYYWRCWVSLMILMNYYHSIRPI